MTSVDITSVAKTYGTSPVLQDINIRFPEGSFTSLLGPSGSGKTTLLRIIAGFILPDAGTVMIGSRDVTQVPVWARNIGIVFQSYALFPHMTVSENVAFGLARRGIRGEEARRQVEQALDMVRLGGFGGRKPKQLSGGQQQRVALARAIVIKPSVLLLDEPLSALDRRLRQEMQVELIRIQRESGLTTIFVTHDQEEALALSDSVAILDRGRIIQSGSPTEIYEKPRTRFAAQFLGDSNFLHCRKDGGDLKMPDGNRIRTTSTLPESASEITVAVRPEKMSIHPAGVALDGAANSLAATVKTVIYAGPALTYVLEDKSGAELKLFAQNRTGEILASGTDVVVTWGPEHTIPLEA